MPEREVVGCEEGQVEQRGRVAAEDLQGGQAPEGLALDHEGPEVVHVGGDVSLGARGDLGGRGREGQGVGAREHDGDQELPVHPHLQGLPEEMHPSSRERPPEAGVDRQGGGLPGRSAQLRVGSSLTEDRPPDLESIEPNPIPLGDPDGESKHVRVRDREDRDAHPVLGGSCSKVPSSLIFTCARSTPYRVKNSCRSEFMAATRSVRVWTARWMSAWRSCS